jgi:hypothetical protein
MRRPEETSRWFADTADEILAQVAAAGEISGKEMQSTVTDLQILAGLARYHSRRLLAGVSYNLYKETGDLTSFDEAIALEKSAIAAWGQIVSAAGDVYSQNLAFGAHAVGFSRHWKEEQQLLTANLEALLAERAQASPRPGAKHYALHAVESAPSATLLPAKGLEISAGVHSAAPVKWVRLRYRHLTQYEDYETVEMTLDAKTGLYTGRIPQAFATPNWALMYFVEVVDQNGAGRIFPDLETQTPYVVIASQKPVN